MFSRPTLTRLRRSCSRRSEQPIPTSYNDLSGDISSNWIDRRARKRRWTEVRNMGRLNCCTSREYSILASCHMRGLNIVVVCAYGRLIGNRQLQSHHQRYRNSQRNQLSVYLCVYLSVCLSIYLSIYLSIHPTFYQYFPVSICLPF